MFYDPAHFVYELNLLYTIDLLTFGLQMFHVKN